MNDSGFFGESLINNLAETLQALPDLLFEFDRAGRYKRIWARDPDLLVAEEASLYGKKVADVLPAEAAATVMSAIAEAEDTGHSGGQVIHLDLPQGARFFELSTAAKLPVGIGEPLYLMTSRDITVRKMAELALAESKKRYRDLIVNLPVCVHEVDLEGKFLSINQAGISMLRVESEAQVIDHSIFEFVASDDTGLVRNMLQAAIRGEVVHFEFSSIGSPLRWFKSSFVPMHDEHGNVCKLLGISDDVTERRRLEQEQHEAVENLQDLYDHAPCGYHSVDPDGLIIQINQTELDWMGYSREEVVGKKRMLDFYTEEGRKRSQELFSHFKSVGYVHDLEYEMVRRDGTTFPVLLNAVAIYDQAGNYIKSRAITFDLTTRKDLERQLVEHARTDLITGLNNRRYFFELANREIERSRRFGSPLSMFMIDVDHFKQVNDTYGHEVGDMVLRHISELCKDALRKIDIAGRIGGEEFAMLLPETNGEEALEVAERLRKAIANAALTLDIGEIRNAVSIGITSWHGDDLDDLDAMLRRADKAMYKAKSHGRNCVRSEK